MARKYFERLLKSQTLRQSIYNPEPSPERVKADLDGSNNKRIDKLSIMSAKQDNMRNMFAFYPTVMKTAYRSGFKNPQTMLQNLKTIYSMQSGPTEKFGDYEKHR